jgi:gliding motility-associated-like protein
MRKRLPLFVALVFMAATGRAQQVIHACCDTFICLPGSPVQLSAEIDSGSTGELLQILDDTYSQVVDLGFPFTFYGTTYTQCVLSTNAYITFDLSKALQYSPWPINYEAPSPFNPLNCIYGPWHDVDPSQPPYGTMGFGTFGEAPNRFFVFNFCSVPMYQCNDTLFTGQIILYEQNSLIEIHLGEKRICPTWNDAAAIEGVVDATGNNGVIIEGRNYPDVWTAFNDAYRFTPSGNSYTYEEIPYAPVPFAAGEPHWTTLAGNDVGDGYTITVTPTVTTSYIVNTASCGFSADTVTITVGAIPVDYQTKDLSCQNADDGVLYADPTDNSGPYTFVWTNASNDTLEVYTGTSDSLNNLPPGSYVVTITNTLGCTATHSYTITSPVYDAAFSVAPALICDGTPVTFNNLSFGDIQSYFWTFGDGGTSTDISPMHLYAVPGDYQVTLTIQLSPTCTDVFMQTVSVHPNIMVETAVSSPPYCVGESVDFTDLSIGNPAQWNWSFGDGGTSELQNPAHVYSSQGTYKVYVVIADEFCGAGADSFTLDVFAVPDPKLREDTMLCGGEIQLLSANAEGSSYLWSTGETTPDITFVMPNEDVTVWVKVDNNGCSGYDSVFFKNHCVIVVPTAFSPNDDGKNDRIRPLGSTVNEFDFIMYNRWGEEVFRQNSGDIHEGWDGKLKGEPQPVGVYVYYLSGRFISGEAFTLKGNVTLVR